MQDDGREGHLDAKTFNGVQCVENGVRSVYSTSSRLHDCGLLRAVGSELIFGGIAF